MMENENKTKKIVLSAIFAAVAVVGSTINFPFFGSKCAPIQHMVNVMCAVFVGPAYGTASAFIASLVRNLAGIGSPLAFPGSMCGAFLSGMMYKKQEKLSAALVGEVFGTGIVGGLLSYPIAYLIMGNKQAALFTFVIPFLISTGVGSIIAGLLIKSIEEVFIKRRKEV